jgi:DNA-binding NtrC family response regulator
MTDSNGEHKVYTAILVCKDADRMAMLSSALNRQGLEVSFAGDGTAALRTAKKVKPDFVIACRDLPDTSGIKVIQSLKKQTRSPIAVGVIVGPTLAPADKQRLLDQGADEYIELDAPEADLNLRVLRLVARKEIGIIGRSEKMLQIIETVETIAPTKVTVLITGESGTGKELIAKAIHLRSPRRGKPFIAVNCGALPQGILESELFGHERGSFTGAISQRKGRFEVADGGTLLLDEVGEMHPGTQVKLLRVLEEEKFMRVGGSHDVEVDVRVIASTNRDLAQLVEEGSFRTDLFYRLNVVSIHVPPLRERRDDIVPIFFAIVEETCRKNNIDFGGITDDALAALVAYRWPGNVRELRNLVESLVILSGGRRITLANLPGHLISGDVTRDLPVAVNRPRDEVERDLFLWRLAEIDARVAELTRIVIALRETLAGSAYPSKQPLIVPGGAAAAPEHAGEAKAVTRLKDAERDLIARTLISVGGNRKSAAKLLGIPERTFYRRMKQYGLS